MSVETDVVGRRQQGGICFIGSCTAEPMISYLSSKRNRKTHLETDTTVLLFYVLYRYAFVPAFENQRRPLPLTLTVNVVFPLSRSDGSSPNTH